MEALKFDFKPLRFAYSKVFGKLYQGAYFGRLSALSYGEHPEPELPNDEWVKVRTVYSGICASDMHAIFLSGSLDNPTTPFISFPMVLGHEVVGTVERVGREVRGLDEGERVLIMPILSCVTRGIDPPCPPCEEGNVAVCRNFAEGSLPPGLIMGENSRINGAFASFVVAHQKQCLKIPEGVSFKDAVIADPFSTSLHAILQNPPNPGDNVLVYSLGTLGLSTVIALRTLYPDCHIIAVGRHAFQKDLASRLGAHNVLISGHGIFQEVAEILGGKVYKVYRGKPIVIGGVNIVYDCAGSADTIETSLRLIKEKGTVVLIGVASPKRFEWSPLWLREISLVGSMSAGADNYGGRTMNTFEIYLELIRDGIIDVKPLVTHKFRLEQYQQAFETCANKRLTKSIKVLFDFS